jgi:O-antigen ligase
VIPFFLVKKNYLMNKILLALLMLPLFITFYITNARNAILGLFTGIIIYGLLKNKWFLAVILLLIIIFLAAAPLSVKERVMSIADLEHPSNRARIVMWETGMRIIKDNILLGVGDVDINKVYRMYKKPEFHGEGSHMHSNIFQELVNFGAAGFICWLALMIYMFARQIRIYQQIREFEFLNILAMISIASMAALQVSGLTEWNFGDAEYAAVFWFNLALAFTAYRLSLKGDTL